MIGQCNSADVILQGTFKKAIREGGFSSTWYSQYTPKYPLYIFIDMNNLRKSNLGLPDIDIYIKAYNAKIIPIFLTVISTVLGLTPFLLGGKTESFWFALAAGTTGGLVFSLLVLIVFLPLLVRNVALRGNKVPASDHYPGSLRHFHGNED